MTEKKKNKELFNQYDFAPMGLIYVNQNSQVTNNLAREKRKCWKNNWIFSLKRDMHIQYNIGCLTHENIRLFMKRC